MPSAVLSSTLPPKAYSFAFKHMAFPNNRWCLSIATKPMIGPSTSSKRPLSMFLCPAAGSMSEEVPALCLLSLLKTSVGDVFFGEFLCCDFLQTRFLPPVNNEVFLSLLSSIQSRFVHLLICRKPSLHLKRAPNLCRLESTIQTSKR
jgi:hypothetical protein